VDNINGLEGSNQISRKIKLAKRAARCRAENSNRHSSELVVGNVQSLHVGRSKEKSIGQSAQVIVSERRDPHFRKTVESFGWNLRQVIVLHIEDLEIVTSGELSACWH
jgi:hypothetical protein